MNRKLFFAVTLMPCCIVGVDHTLGRGFGGGGGFHGGGGGGFGGGGFHGGDYRWWKFPWWRLRRRGVLAVAYHGGAMVAGVDLAVAAFTTMVAASIVGGYHGYGGGASDFTAVGSITGGFGDRLSAAHAVASTA